MIMHMRRVCSWFVALCACMTHSRLASAELLYVGGAAANDDNPGSAAAPYASLDRAAAQAQPGDTITVRAGTYSAFTIYTDGTASSRVVFQRDPASNSRPIIRGRVTIAASYVTLRGFEVTGSDLMGINVYGGSQLELVDNVIHDNQRGAIYAAPAEGRSSNDILVQGNVAYRNSLDNSARASSGGWAGAIQTGGANRLTIVENEVYENWGEGISLTVTDGSVAARNVVHDNYSVELYMDHATSSAFDSNLVFDSGKTEFFRNLNGSWPATGIQISNEPGYGDVPPSRGNRIVNNIVVGGRTGLFYWRAPEDFSGLQETLIAHNTFYGAKEVLLKVDDGPHSGARFINNLFVAAGADVVWVEGGGLDFRNNVWSGGQLRGPGDLSADCGLARPGGTTAADYRIASISSACVGAGMALSEVTSDFFGGTRAGRTDVGAHQFGSVVPDPDVGGAGGMTGQGGTGGVPSPTGGKSGSTSTGGAGKGPPAPSAAGVSSDGTSALDDEPQGRATAPLGCACRAATPTGWSGWCVAAAWLFAVAARRPRGRRPQQVSPPS
jgi:parallel beta-helix repeat protein